MDLLRRLPFDVQAGVLCASGHYRLRGGELVAQIRRDDQRRTVLAACLSLRADCTTIIQYYISSCIWVSLPPLDTPFKRKRFEMHFHYMHEFNPDFDDCRLRYTFVPIYMKNGLFMPSTFIEDTSPNFNKYADAYSQIEHLPEIDSCTGFKYSIYYNGHITTTMVVTWNSGTSPIGWWV